MYAVSAFIVKRFLKTDVPNQGAAKLWVSLWVGRKIINTIIHIFYRL